MSVINKMLKDLDDRQHTSEPSISASTPTQPNVAVKSTNWPMFIVMTIIAALLAVISWQMVGNKTNPSNGSGTQPRSADSLLTNSANKNQTQQPLSNRAAQTTSIDGVEVVLEPEELIPADEEAIIQEPAAIPETMIADSVVKDSGVEYEAEPVTSIERPLESAESIADPSNSIAEAELNDEAKRQVSEVAAQVNSKSADAKPQVKAEPEFVIVKTSSQLTPEQRIEKMLNKAKESYDRGYITEAISQLTKIIAISDKNEEARNLLAAAWYGRGEGNKSISILNDGLQRYPMIESWRLTAAKIFYKENNAAGAFSYLDVDLQQASKEFYTLKGNLARELKNFAKAELAYTELTQLEPYVGNWWLGLAIAQDSQNKQAEAAKSYIKVLEVGGVSSQSISFSKQRIEALQG